jgi:hypothetical protein
LDDSLIGEKIYPYDFAEHQSSKKHHAEENEQMNSYNVTLNYEDRSSGSTGRTIKIDASNIAGAIGKATREFVKSLDRKQRFDMNKGLKIEAARIASEPAEQPAAAAEAAAGS